MEDWYHVIWTDKATFKTRLNRQSYYVTWKHNGIIESQHFKPIFTSRRFSISILEAIILGLKEPVHFW